MAEKACHTFASTTQVGLTQVLAPMDTFTLIAELVKALAVPVGAVSIALIFRSEVRALLGRIRKGKVGSAEIEFAEDVRQLSAEASKALPAPPDLTSATIRLSATNPRAAILEAWLQLEAVARKAAFGVNEFAARTAISTGHSLAKNGLLNADELAIFDELRTLRNQATHDPDFSPRPESVLEYTQLAGALSRRLEVRTSGR